MVDIRRFQGPADPRYLVLNNEEVQRFVQIISPHKIGKDQLWFLDTADFTASILMKYMNESVDGFSADLTALDFRVTDTEDAIVQTNADLATLETDIIDGTIEGPLRSDLLLTSGASLVGFQNTGSDTVEREVASRLQDTISVEDYTTPQAAVTQAISVNGAVFWPAGDHVASGSVPGLWDVEHSGTGRLVRGAAVLPFSPREADAIALYVDPAGDDANDGLTADFPLATVQRAVNVFVEHGSRGRWTINLAAGTYNENVSVSSHTPMEFPLTIKGPAVGGHPNVPTATIAAVDVNSAVLTASDAGGRILLQDIKLHGASNSKAVICSRNRVGSTNLHITGCLSAVSITHSALFTASGGIWTGLGSGVVDGTGFGSFYNSTHNLVAANTAAALVIEGYERGLLLNEGAQGHLDFTVLQDCGTGMWVARGAGACNTKSMQIKRCGVGVEARGQWFNNGITFGTGGDANTINVQSSGSAPEFDFRTDDFKSKTMRVQQASNVAAHTGTTAITKVYTSPGLRNWMISVGGDVSELNLSVECPSLAGTCTIRVGINNGTSDFVVAGAVLPAGSTAAQVRAIVQHTAASAQRGSLSIIHNAGSAVGTGATSVALKDTAFTYYISLALSNAADSVTLRTVDFRTTLGG